MLVQRGTRARRLIRPPSPSWLPSTRRWYFVDGVPQSFPHAWDKGMPSRRPEDEKHIAIVGGGITGLVTAFSLFQSNNSRMYGSWRGLPGLNKPPKVTVYEASDHTGGWLDSHYVDFNEPAQGDNRWAGNALFEAGVRTLRSHPWTLDLLQRLCFSADDIIEVPQDSPAMQNRFVYYPDRLVKLPGGTPTVAEILRTMREPLINGLSMALLKETFRPYRGLPEDMSVGRLISERFGPDVADLGSAIMHGIYAGDIDKLSAASILPSLHRRLITHGGVVKGVLADLYQSLVNQKRQVMIPEGHPFFTEYLRDRSDSVTPQRLDLLEEHGKSETLKLHHLLKRLDKPGSVFSFRAGIGQLARDLTDYLKFNYHVEFLTDTKVSSIEIEPGNRRAGVTITASSTKKNQQQQQQHLEPRKYTQVVGTLPSAKLAPLIKAPQAPAGAVERLRSLLEHNPSVTVMVVNMYFHDPHLLAGVEGFGYLIPRHVPLEQNPEGALGVVFDSVAIPGQDAVTPAADGSERPTGTKLTVMLGGHWWDWMRDLGAQAAAEEEGNDPYPSDAKSIEMARTVLARHLGITAEPAAAMASLQRDCIPQYLVGHRARLAEMHQILVGDGFEGNLMVGGSSYKGVSCNDCIMSGAKIARMMSYDVLDSGLVSPTEGYCVRTHTEMNPM